LKEKAEKALGEENGKRAEEEAERGNAVYASILKKEKSMSPRK